MNTQIDVLAGRACTFFLKEKYQKFKTAAFADPLRLKG